MITTKSTPLLASFATIKSLSDAKKYESSYQILAEFIRYIIVTNNLYSFSAIEMKRLLNENFGFSIPEAVIRTSIKKMPGIDLNNKMFTANLDEIGSNSLFLEKKANSDVINSNIINSLMSYIIERTGNPAIWVDTLTKELAAFLLDDSNYASGKYANYISEFIIKNQDNKYIQDGLTNIREGSILYLGLNYNINEVGSITKPLTLYLGTEILFSLSGYNGEIHKQLADDFFEQVRSANVVSSKKIILRYFAEVKKEIEDFFSTAEEIVDRKRPRLLDKPAMAAIINGCETSSDVVVKKADFYHLIQYSYGIVEDPNNDYYGEVLFESNLESMEYCDEDENGKKENGIKFISHINKLRNGNIFYSDIESEYLLVTNAKITLAISKEQSDRISSEKGIEYISNFAVSLGRITNLLWYKLGKGFGSKDYPADVSAILKARVVLSSSIAKCAEQAFSDAKKQYEDGKITEDQLAGRIIMLRDKPKLPEELQGDDIDETMDFSPEFLSQYEEKAKADKKALEEKEALIDSITADRDAAISERDSVIAKHEVTMRQKDDENDRLRTELEAYHKKDEDEARKKENRRNTRRFIWSIAWKVMAILAITMILLLCQKKYETNFIPYLWKGIDFLGVIFTIWKAIKTDKEKYFPPKDAKQ